MVGLVAVVLVIAGAGSLILTRNAARNQAQQQLVSEANSLTSSKIGDAVARRCCDVVRATLKLEDADLITIDRLGNVVDAAARGPHARRTSTWRRSSRGRRPRAARATSSTPWRRSRSPSRAPRLRRAPARRLRGHVRRPPHPRRRRPRAELGLLHRRRRGGAARRRAGGLADEPPHGPAAGRGHGGDRPHRVGRAGQPRARSGRSDYPEFASLAGSINDMAQSLEDGRARERHLLLAVSHDLRTPLTSIRGFAEAIQDGAIEDSGQAADVIIAESRRLERLVGRPARPDQARGAPDVDLPAPDRRRRGGRHDGGGVPAGGGQERAADRAAGARPGRGVRAVRRPRAPRWSADPDRLAQLLANLLENAITFARTTVTVALARRTTRPERASSRSTTTGPASRRATWSGCSSASTGPTGGRTARWARGSGWPSWPSWRRPWAARCAPSRRSTPTAGRASW